MMRRRKGAPYSGGDGRAQWRFRRPGADCGNFLRAIAFQVMRKRYFPRSQRLGPRRIRRIFDPAPGSQVGASPSGKASVFGIDIPRFESWRPSQSLLCSLNRSQEPVISTGIHFGRPYILRCIIAHQCCYKLTRIRVLCGAASIETGEPVRQLRVACALASLETVRNANSGGEVRGDNGV